METVAVWLVLALIGLIISFIGGFYTGSLPGAMTGVFGSMIVLIPLLKFFSIGKEKKILPLFKDLEDNEKFLIWPDSYGKMHTTIMKIRHEGVLYKKGWGFIDDKGTEFSIGGDPIGFAHPKSGVTFSVEPIEYTSQLFKNRDIPDYDSAIKKYLGEAQYNVFCHKFRTKQKPNIYDINKEIDYLMHSKPKNELKEIVFGDTWSFNKNFLPFLKYNFHPMALDNAINTEKIWVKQEKGDYGETNKMVGYAKAILIILFGLMIFIAVIGSLDLNIGNIFGGM